MIFPRDKAGLAALAAVGVGVGLFAWHAATMSSCAYDDYSLREGPNMEGLESETADRTPQWSKSGDIVIVNINGNLMGTRMTGDGIFEFRGVSDRNRYSPSLSANGFLIYQIGFHDKPEYLRYERHIGISNIGDPEKKPAIVKVDDQCNSIYPALWRHGTRFAFILKPDCRKTATERMLGIGDANGRNIDYYPISDGHEGKVIWSNDGMSIAFATKDGLSIFSVNVGERKLVKTGVVISLPAWSLDDSSLYYVRRNLGDSAHSMLYSISSDGSDARLIADIGNIKVREVKLSPDGNKLLFDAAYIIDTSGENLVEIQKDFWQDDEKSKGVSDCPPCATRHASWSPDGQKIAIYEELLAEHYSEYPSLNILADDGSHVRTLRLQ